MNILTAPVKRDLKIIQIGLPYHIKQRLIAMGIYQGGKVEVIYNKSHVLIIKVFNGVYALPRDYAEKIEVDIWSE